jgi:protein transport protein YIF1
MYIPLMAFVTYVLLTTLIAGLNGKFEPQLLGITFSNASMVIVLELAVLWLGRYFLNISSESQIYDLVAYSGYKFVGVIVTIAVAAMMNGGRGTGGYVGWVVFGYTFLANAFFLVSPLTPPPKSNHPCATWTRAELMVLGRFSCEA